MLGHEETLALIKRAQAGEESAKERLVEENLPLVRSVVKRFKGRLEYDDLMQLGAMGFLKAVAGFDEGFGVRFSTYAVPMIMGEIRRYLRDNSVIRVSRHLKDLAYQIFRLKEAYVHEHQEEPSIAWLAEQCEVKEKDVADALDACQSVLSIFEPIYSSDGPDRERKLIILRYFRDKTQSEVAAELGVSQVQVSRMENKILSKMRENMRE